MSYLIAAMKTGIHLDISSESLPLVVFDGEAALKSTDKKLIHSGMTAFENDTYYNEQNWARHELHYQSFQPVRIVCYIRRYFEEYVLGFVLYIPIFCELANVVGI